jgi:uncharacterized protein
MGRLRLLEGSQTDSFEEFYDAQKGNYFVPELPTSSKTWTDLIHDLHRRGLRGSGQIIAILDSGFVPSHPTISKSLVQNPPPFDFTGEGIVDLIGHGTLVSLLVLAVAPEARLMHIKITARDDRRSQTEAAESSMMAKAIRQAAQGGATLINISAGVEREGEESRRLLDSEVGPCNCEICFAAEETAKEFGVTIIAAAGNNPRPGVRYCPASAAEVVPVIGLVNDTPVALPTLTYYSGVRAFGSVSFSGKTGSSFATPLITGTATLIAQQDQQKIRNGETFTGVMLYRSDDNNILTFVGEVRKDVPHLPLELFKRNIRRHGIFVYDLELLSRMDQSEIKVRMPKVESAVYLGGSPELVRSLIARGEDVNAKDSGGWTALLLATTKNDVAMVRALLESGASADLPNELGETALHSAASNGYTAIIQTLLSAGATIDFHDAKGFTPLMNATMEGHVDSVAALLKGGAEPDAAQEDGLTPLVFAVGEGHKAIATALLDHGADPNRHGVAGNTALMWSVMQGHGEMAEILLAHGAQVNATNSHGQSALMYAAGDGNVGLVRAFTSHGADARLRDHAGNTAIEYATQKGHSEVVRVLRRSPRSSIAARLKMWLSSVRRRSPVK